MNESCRYGTIENEAEKTFRRVIRSQEDDESPLRVTCVTSLVTGMPQLMPFSTLSHPLTMLETQLDVPISLSAMQRVAKVKA
jgi:hypothetical protein